MDNKLKLVGCITPNYVKKTKDYFESIERMKSCEISMVMVEFNTKTDPKNTERYLRENFTSIKYLPFKLPKTHSHYMIQHGEFLDAMYGIKDTDLICLSDADVFFQRDFTVGEQLFLQEQYSDGAVGVYWNSGSWDTLRYEAQRMEVDEKWIKKWAAKEMDLPCMNCGVMVATVDHFRQLRECYNDNCEEYYESTPHRSRCQLLINWCWAQLGCKVKVLPAYIHQHGHYGLQSVCKIVKDKYMCADTEVVICHKLNKPTPTKTN